MWRQHGVLAFVAAGEELVLLLLEIENVHADGARVADDDAAVRVGHDAVGTDKKVKVRFADDEVEGLGPEAQLELDLAIVAEDTLKLDGASAVEQQVGDIDLGGWLLGLADAHAGAT